MKEVAGSLAVAAIFFLGVIFGRAISQPPENVRSKSEMAAPLEFQAMTLKIRDLRDEIIQCNLDLEEALHATR